MHSRNNTNILTRWWKDSITNDAARESIRVAPGKEEQCDVDARGECISRSHSGEGVCACGCVRRSFLHENERHLTIMESQGSAVAHGRLATRHRVVVQQLVNERNVAENHTAAAVALQAQLVQRLARVIVLVQQAKVVIVLVTNDLAAGEAANRDDHGKA